MAIELSASYYAKPASAPFEQGYQDRVCPDVFADVVKTLQRVSGVAEGQELASGLYVHGGNGDENLYLIDGTPLYNTNHAWVFSPVSMPMW